MFYTTYPRGSDAYSWVWGLWTLTGSSYLPFKDVPLSSTATGTMTEVSICPSTPFDAIRTGTVKNYNACYNMNPYGTWHLQYEAYTGTAMPETLGQCAFMPQLNAGMLVANRCKSPSGMVLFGDTANSSNNMAPSAYFYRNGLSWSGSTFEPAWCCAIPIEPMSPGSTDMRPVKAGRNLRHLPVICEVFLLPSAPRSPIIKKKDF